MAKWLSQAVLEKGPDHLKTLAAGGKTLTQHIVKAYAAADSYATVVGNSVMSVAIVDADLTWGAGTPSGRALTVAAMPGVSIASDSGASPDLHVVLVNTTDSEVHVVSDETTNQVLTTGGTKDLPAWAIQCPQPA